MSIPAPIPAQALTAAVADEWAEIVAVAVLGTDRRPLAAAAGGWDAWATSSDPATVLLDRAAAVVAARRAGARPEPPLDPPSPAPTDRRPSCPAACGDRLQRLLAGEHDVLLGEWLALCAAGGFQLPWVALPTLLLRGRRAPALDATVRRLAGPRAGWLADAVPELGVRPVVAAAPAPTPSSAQSDKHIATLDGGAAVTLVVQSIVDRSATWAAAPQLRAVVVGLDPAWLPTLVAELSRLGYDQLTERTRAELLALAEFRAEMHREFAAASTVTT